MTKIESYDLNCKACGKDFKAPIYESVNITLDPELLEKIWNGTLNTVKCPKCKKEHFVAVPLLFHDMEYKVVENGKEVKKSKMTWIDLNDGIEGWKRFHAFLDMEGYFDEFKKREGLNH